MNKSTKAACLSAFLFPGSGQFFLKKYLKGSLFATIATIGLVIIMSAVFTIALTIANDIQLGKITLNITTIHNLTQETMAIFQEPSLIGAKVAMICSWVISTIDAWVTGKKIEKEN